MRNTSKLLAALMMALGLGTVAMPSHAYGGMGGKMDCSPMERGGKFEERRAERMQQKQQQLHDALKLNADQEVAWKKFSETRPGPMRGGMQREEMQKLNAPERAEKMLEFSKQQQERMTAHVAALKTFYATLTPEQQKTFDGFHAGPRGGRRGPPPAAPAAPAVK